MGQSLPPAFPAADTSRAFADHRVRRYLAPQRIVWQTDSTDGSLRGVINLLRRGTGQAELTQRNLCIIKSTGKSRGAARPGFVLDFGRELHGGIQLVTGMFTTQDPVQHQPVRVRIRLGESVSEVMSDIDTLKDGTNDHATRDFILALPWLGVQEVGNSGFRFARVDLVDPDVELLLKEVNAIFVYRDLPYQGSFQCSDERLNQIWMTGAYTVHLNTQEYVWDGIKRDRLVWVGDMYPEVMTISSVFGYTDAVPKSLDLARDQNPLPNWMNTMSTYSMWWVLLHRDWYCYQGDLVYLRQQKPYLTGLLRLLASKVDDTGRERVNDGRFLDWPTSEDSVAVHAGIQALLLMTMGAGQQLCTQLGDATTASLCQQTAQKLQRHQPDPGTTKQAAALLALAGMMPPGEANARIAEGGARHFSTFYGYFMLQAMAKAGNYAGAMATIRQFWGGMLDVGATTFWEDFNLDWLDNAARIDELVPPGKKDIHGDCGAYCYKGLRHSLCHGWASGPTSWLTQHVLGVSVVEPGGRVLRIVPHLGELAWAKGTFPTRFGVVQISHVRQASGKVSTSVKAPKDVTVLTK